MIRKILLVAQTVRYLKLKQIIYQLYNRLRPQRNLDWYIGKIKKQPEYNSLLFNLQVDIQEDIITPGNSFTFLNIKHTFDAEIDWGYQAYGKLWNYNLQYFNFLNQVNITVERKQQLINDITNSLKNGKLKLEPYPVALRVLNEIRFFSLQKQAEPQSIKSLYGQLSYLSSNFEYHLLGNHLLENAFALLMGGVFFNEQKWIGNAMQVLKAELDEQILNDGGHFELSPMYHQIILFRVLELVDWYGKIENKDDAFLAFITDKAGNMLGWIQNVSFNNGDIGHFNDSATGIAFTTNQLLSFAKELNIIPNRQLQLKESGYRKYTANNYECVIDFAEIGPAYQSGHGHADALSFILNYNNLPVFVEAGTSTYEANQIRYYERSTAAHNTVVIADSNQSQVWGAFRVAERAHTRIISETANAIEAEHDGYLKRYGCIHKRSFVLNANSVSIVDHVRAKTKDVNRVAYFHFHPDINILRTDSAFNIKGIGTVSFKGSLAITTEAFTFADGFNKTRSSIAIKVSFTDTLETLINFDN